MAGRGGHQVQLPPRQLRGLVESGDFGFCGALQEQSDGRADEEAGPVCRCLQILRRQQRQVEGTPEAGGGPPPYYVRAHQAKRHEVIRILIFMFVILCLFILNSLVLGCVGAVMHEIFLIFLYSVFVCQSRTIKFYSSNFLVFCIFQCHMILNIETFSVQIRRGSAAFVTVL